jgi:hypothetical protein
MNIKFLNDGTEFDVGDTIRIESTIEEQEPFEESWSLTDPQTVEITITGYNDNEVVSSQSMTKESTGKYFYNWDTTGLDAGDYEVVVDSSTNGISEVEDDWIKITD